MSLANKVPTHQKRKKYPRVVYKKLIKPITIYYYLLEVFQNLIIDSAETESHLKAFVVAEHRQLLDLYGDWRPMLLGSTFQF